MTEEEEVVEAIVVVEAAMAIFLNKNKFASSAWHAEREQMESVNVFI